MCILTFSPKCHDHHQGIYQNIARKSGRIEKCRLQNLIKDIAKVQSPSIRERFKLRGVGTMAKERQRQTTCLVTTRIVLKPAFKLNVCCSVKW